jgi:hypothetical protein
MTAPLIPVRASSEVTLAGWRGGDSTSGTRRPRFIIFISNLYKAAIYKSAHMLITRRPAQGAFSVPHFNLPARPDFGEISNVQSTYKMFPM